MLFCFLSITGYSQPAINSIENYFGIPKNIQFENVDYTLSWSAHPNKVYFKQEYLPRGQNPDHFSNMLMIDFAEGDFTAKDVANNKIGTLQERKKTDPVCNYELIESPDGKEFILDFLMSVSANEKVNLVEWNCYHYKSYTDKAGHKGVVLYGISNRAYDDGVTPFLQNLPKQRKDIINAIIKFPIPEIQIR